MAEEFFTKMLPIVYVSSWINIIHLNLVFSVMSLSVTGRSWGQLEVALAANTAVTGLMLTAPLASFTVGAHVIFLCE